MEILLPWPSSKLSPNARVHYQVLAKHKAEYKLDCQMLAYKEIPVFEDGKIALDITFHPPKNYRFDLDGLLSRCKSGLDGVCSVWGIDDYRFDPITIRRGEKREGGAVVVRVGQ